MNSNQISNSPEVSGIVCRNENCKCKKFVPNVWKSSLCSTCLHTHGKSAPTLPLKIVISSPKSPASSNESPRENEVKSSPKVKIEEARTTRNVESITSSPMTEIKEELATVDLKPKVKPQRSSSDRRVGFASSVAVQTDPKKNSSDAIPPVYNGNSNGDEVVAMESNAIPIEAEEAEAEQEPEAEEEKSKPNNAVEKMLKKKNRMNRKGLAPSLTWFLRPLEHESDTVHQFAQIGSVQGIKQLLAYLPNEQKKNHLINGRDNMNEQTPLHVAIQNEQKDVAKYLIEIGCDINVKDKIGRDALLYTARYNCLETMKILIQKGADENSIDCYGETSLHIAAVNGFQDIVRFLTEETRIDINAANTFKETALHKAARQGDLEMAKFLVQHGALCLSALQGKPKDMVAKDKFAELYEFLVSAEKKEMDADEEVEVLLRKLRWKDRHTRMLMSVARQSTSITEDVPLDENQLNEVNTNLQDALEKIYQEITEDIKSSGGGSPTIVAKRKTSAAALVKRNSVGALIKIPSESHELRVVEPNDNVTDVSVEIEGFFEPYRNEYFKIRHLLFAIEDTNLEESDSGEKEGCIVAVKKQKNDQGNYEGLFFSKWVRMKLLQSNRKGYTRIEILEKNLNPENKDFGEQIREYLDKLVFSKQLNIIPPYLDKSKTSEKTRETINNVVQEEKKKLHRPNTKRSDKSKKSFYQITKKTFSVELLGLETQLGRGKCYCIAVAYSKPGQTNESEIFKNESSEAFEGFMDILADKIEIKGWSGFPGGFNPSCDTGVTYYTSWRGFEIMFHAVPFLTADQTRRLVANDKAIIYFQEHSTFYPNFRGNVNSAGIVVRPEADGSFGLACFLRTRVKLFNPQIPSIVNDRTKLKDIIIATAINAIEATDKSPPFVYLYSNSWQDTINDLISQYPKKKNKQKM